MIELVVLCALTLMVLVGVGLLFTFGKAPVYRPDIDQIQGLLTRLLEQQLAEPEWTLFLAMPIRHDAALDALRQRCNQVQEQYGLRAREGPVRLTEAGLIKIRFLLHQIEQAGARSF